MPEKKQLNIHQRMLAIVADMGHVGKGSTVNITKSASYKYTSHDAVTNAVKPLLVKHGVCVIPSVESVVQDGNRTEMHVVIDFVNSDDPADKIAVASYGHGVDTSDKGPGKAYSYAYKYAMMKVFAMDVGPEGDNEAHDVQHESQADREAAQERAAFEGKKQAFTTMVKHGEKCGVSEDTIKDVLDAMAIDCGHKGRRGAPLALWEEWARTMDNWFPTGNRDSA
jgi:hypothetical protein